ncbi:MAG TPA: ATP synthase F0 subunit B [Nitrospirae bacterium]|nr:ATP synthase F0 subunit B [Nitrospirota bacterium]HDK41286.1 ATP synthase F0 subunit B [Nitrospirota bacterium]
MLEIEPFWLSVQTINFLALIVLLNYLLFKPLLGLLKERDNNIRGALDKAKETDKQREALMTQIQSKLSKTRNKAKTVFDDLGKEGQAVQKKALDEATARAVEINRKAKEDLEAEAKKVRDSLRKEVEGFSGKIVEKMVGA